MSFTRLKTHTFLNDVTASTVTDWYPIDYTTPGENVRGVMGTKVSAAGDSIILELRTLDVRIGKSSNIPVTAGDVIVTATTWAGSVTNFSAVIQGAYTHLRIRKTGSDAGATVVGVV